jgi:hypothetical protein
MLIKIIFFIYILLILYILYKCFNNNEEDEEDYEDEIEDFNDSSKQYLLNNDIPMSNIICSKKCCSTQWPTPNDTQIIDDRINENDYFPTNLNCNNGINDTGCVCKPKKQN